MIAAEDRLPTATRAEVITELRAQTAGQWQSGLLIVIIMTAAAAAGLVLPLALGRVVDAVTEGRSTSYLGAIAVLIIAATVLQAVLSGLGIIVSARFFDRLVARLRERLVERALGLPQTVIERAGTGDLLTRAGDDITNVSQALSAVLPTFSMSVFTIAVTLAGMAAIDPRLLLALVVALPVQVLAVRYYLRAAPPLWAEAMTLASIRSNQVIGSFRGQSTVTAYRLTDQHLDKIAAATWPVVRYGLLTRIVTNRFFTRLTASELAGLAGLLVVGYWLVGSDRASIGAATTGMLFVFRLFQPVREMLFVVDVMQNGLSSLARIVGVLGFRIAGGEPAEPVESVPTRRRATPPAVHIDGVSFSYRDGHPVLRDVDLHIAPGEHVALVGTSGAGKTTMASLIAGIHPPDAGRIRLDGTDIATMERAALSGEIAMISQMTHTFAGPLRDDLTLAQPGATDAEIGAALRAVDATGWVAALPDGLDTIVGAHARQLTAAQEQQLALARLMLKESSVVILDEATAEAGSSGARLLERAADAAIAGRTALIVAHRLSQAARADRIVVMDEGRIVEQGTHDQLVTSGGHYARLWDAWSAHR